MYHIQAVLIPRYIMSCGEVHRSRRALEDVSAKRGQAAYEEHSKNCRRPLRLPTTVAEAFIQELSTAVREKSASIMVPSSKTSISTSNATGRRYTLRIRSPHGNARRTNFTTRCCVSTCRKVNLLTNIQRMRYCAWPIR